MKEMIAISHKKESCKGRRERESDKCTNIEEPYCLVNIMTKYLSPPIQFNYCNHISLHYFYALSPSPTHKIYPLSFT